MLPVLTGIAQLKDMYVILFEDKLVLAKEDPDDTNTNVNFFNFVENNLMLSELIFDCAAGLFPCSPSEYAMIHTGNFGETLDAAQKSELCKD